MRTRNLMAGLALLAAVTAHAEERETSFPAYDGAPQPARHDWIITVEPPATRLVVGDAAPEFSYLGPDGRWHRASELLARGSVLLVFGADDRELLAMEQARDAFLDLGVVPAFVLDVGPGQVASLQRRLRLASPLLSDPRRAIAELYNSVDPHTARHAPGFFVLDAKHTIKAIGHGAIPPTERMLALSAELLGRPLQQGTRVASGF